VGATQSGKSTLAKMLTLGWSRFLIHDPKAKADLVPPDSIIVRDGAAAAAAWPGRIVYHPPVLRRRDTRIDFDIAARRVLAVRGGGVCLHELKALCDTDNCEAGLDALVYQGSELRIPMIYCTQEPVRLYTTFLTQASIVIAFYLGAYHREYLARELGAEALREPVPFDHSYVVWRRSNPEQIERRPPLPLATRARGR
jgi:hypothetical protein